MKIKKLPFVSIVIPVLNEEKNLPKVLSSISKLNYPEKKFEVIIVDGYSKDKSVEIAKKFGAKVVYNSQVLRGAGCQIGIESSQGEFLAFTDADCVVPNDWLRGLLKHFKSRRVAAVGGANVTPQDDTPFAKGAGEAIWLLTRAGSRYGFSNRKVVEIYHNPGCNVVYRKEAVIKAGGYNPNLTTCEDEELDFRLYQKGYKILFTPDISVDHYRRPTYRKVYIQSYRYSLGRAEAVKMHWRMVRWFHFGPSLLLLSLLINSFLFIFIPNLQVLILFYGFFVFSLFLGASLYLYLTKKTVAFYVYLGLIGNWWIGWGLGFFQGLVFRKTPNFRSLFSAYKVKL